MSSYPNSTARASLMMLAAIATQAAMPEGDNRALAMTATEHDGRVEIAIVGRSARPLSVRYELSVEGASRTRHAGRTRVDAQRRTLSVVTIDGSSPWQARLSVEQPGLAPYAITLDGA